MPGQATVLQKQLSEIREQISSAQKQLTELSSPDADSPEIQNAVERALREAAQREQTRVQSEGLNNAISTLEREQAEVQSELEEARAQDQKELSDQLAHRGIEKVEALRPAFNDAIQNLRNVVQQLEKLEESYGHHVRAHLADLKRADRPDELYFRAPHEKLVEIPEIALPELKRVNGADNSPIRWYGDIFKVSYGEFFVQVD